MARLRKGLLGSCHGCGFIVETVHPVGEHAGEVEVSHLSFGGFADVMIRDRFGHQLRLNLRALRTVEDDLVGHDGRQCFWTHPHHGDGERKIALSNFPLPLKIKM